MIYAKDFKESFNKFSNWPQFGPHLCQNLVNFHGQSAESLILSYHNMDYTAYIDVRGKKRVVKDEEQGRRGNYNIKLS